MPSTPLKNVLYRLALPVHAPRLPSSAVHAPQGHPLTFQAQYSRVLCRHRVQGSATLIASGRDTSLLLSDSVLTNTVPASSSLFRVASITKMFVAASVMRLRDQGLLDPDAPVSGYLRDAVPPDLLAGITLRHLLSHTSGIEDRLDLEPFLLREAPLSDLLPVCRVSDPGCFRYSNLGYGIVGCVLEAVCNQPVTEIIRQQVLIPLSLRAALGSHTLPEEEIIPVARILPWRRKTLRTTPVGRKPLTAADPARHYGHTAGSLYITPDSLFTFLTAFRDADPRLISGESRQEMLRVHARYGKLSPTLSYGLGLLFIGDPRLSSSRIIGHQGFAYGCADGAFYEEDTGRIMITLNGGCSEARDHRLGLCNRDLLRLTLRKELPSW